MKKIVLGAMALIMAVALAVGLSVGVDTSTAPSASASTCELKYSYDDTTKTYGGKWVKVYTEVAYFHCVGSAGRRWIEPHRMTLGYNLEGGSTPCGWRDSFDGVVANPYLWDRAGHSINPPEITLGCATDTTAERSFVFNRIDNPRLYKCNDYAPRWEVVGRVKIQGDGDLHYTLGGTMWGFIGPSAINC